MLENLVLNVTELADAHGAATLINNLGKEYNYYFGELLDNAEKSIVSRELKELKEIKPSDCIFNSNKNLEIIFSSDISPEFVESYAKRALGIDLSILKAAKRPHTEEEKKKIMEKYGIKKKDKPLALIGNIYHSTHLLNLIRGLKDYTQILISGGNPILGVLIDEYGIKDIQEVAGYGILADLYSIADISIPFDDAREKRYQPLHNFFEQSEGGPAFFILPSRTEQYGFKYFKDKKLIRPCNDCHEIIEKVKKYAKKFNGNDVHQKKWKNLLTCSIGFF